MNNEYPPNWTEIATEIKDQADWHCEHCGHSNDLLSNHVLTVHHVNGIKSDCRYENLVALCQRCHLRIQATFNPYQLSFSFFEPPQWAVNRALFEATRLTPMKTRSNNAT